MGPSRKRIDRLQRLALEALAIFLGVTAGFLADDYRDARNERVRSREAMTQLIEDLTLDAADLEPILPRSQLRVDAVRWLHANLDRRTVSIDSVSDWIDELGQIPPYSYEAVTVAYSGLKTTGVIDRIPDEDLRRDVVYYFEDRQVVLEEVNHDAIEIELDWWAMLAPYIRFAPADSFLLFPHVSIVDLPGLQADASVRYKTIEMANYYTWEVRHVNELLELNARLQESISAYLN